MNAKVTRVSDVMSMLEAGLTGEQVADSLVIMGWAKTYKVADAYVLLAKNRLAVRDLNASDFARFWNGRPVARSAADDFRARLSALISRFPVRIWFA